MKTFRLALITVLTSIGIVILPQLAAAQSWSQISNKRGDNSFTDQNFELFIRRTQVSGKYTTPFGGNDLQLQVAV